MPRKGKPAPALSPFWQQQFWGKRTGWKDGERRTVLLCLYNGRMETASTGTLYAKLWTNWEWVSAWKETYMAFKGGELCWFLCEIRCSVKNGHRYFSVARYPQKLTGPRETLPPETLETHNPPTDA